MHTKQPTTILNKLTAKKYFENAKKLNKYSINNLFDLGNICVILGLFDEAVIHYQDAIYANPGYDEIYLNLGLLYLKMKNDELAKKNLLISYTINSTANQTILSLFNLSLKEKNLDDCEKYLNEAIVLEPNNYVILSNLGVVSSMRNDFKKAIEYYKKSLELDPNYETAKYNLQLAEKSKSGTFETFEFSLFGR